MFKYNLIFLQIIQHITADLITSIDFQPVKSAQKSYDLFREVLTNENPFRCPRNISSGNKTDDFLIRLAAEGIELIKPEFKQLSSKMFSRVFSSLFTKKVNESTFKCGNKTQIIETCRRNYGTPKTVYQNLGHITIREIPKAVLRTLTELSTISTKCDIPELKNITLDYLKALFNTDGKICDIQFCSTFNTSIISKLRNLLFSILILIICYYTNCLSFLKRIFFCCLQGCSLMKESRATNVAIELAPQAVHTAFNISSFLNRQHNNNPISSAPSIDSSSNNTDSFRDEINQLYGVINLQFSEKLKQCSYNMLLGFTTIISSFLLLTIIIVPKTIMVSLICTFIEGIRKNIL